MTTDKGPAADGPGQGKAGRSCGAQGPGPGSRPGPGVGSPARTPARRETGPFSADDSASTAFI